MNKLELIINYNDKKIGKPEYDFFVSEKDSGDKEMFDKLLDMYNYDELSRKEKSTLIKMLSIKHYIDLFSTGHWLEEIYELLWEEFYKPQYNNREKALDALRSQMTYLMIANEKYLTNPLRKGLEYYYNSPFVQLDLYNYEEHGQHAKKLRR